MTLVPTFDILFKDINIKKETIYAYMRTLY